MVVVLVFFYLAILAYAVLLLPVAGFAIYASFQLQRRTAYASWGLLGWLLAAPWISFCLFVVLDGLGLLPDPMHDEELIGFWIPVLAGYLVCLPVFLVPLWLRLFGKREQKLSPA